jgi:hypothetical protein
MPFRAVVSLEANGTDPVRQAKEGTKASRVEHLANLTRKINQPKRLVEQGAARLQRTQHRVYRIAVLAVTRFAMRRRTKPDVFALDFS